MRWTASKDGVIDDPTPLPFRSQGAAVQRRRDRRLPDRRRRWKRRGRSTPRRRIRAPGRRFIRAWNRAANWAGRAGRRNSRSASRSIISATSSSRIRTGIGRRSNFDSDVALADKADNDTINATDPNLKAFFAHGGKLLLYHGWNDQLIAPAQHHQLLPQRAGHDGRRRQDQRLRPPLHGARHGTLQRRRRGRHVRPGEA